MDCLEIEEKISTDFLDVEKKLSKIGFMLIGTQESTNEKIYLVKKRKN